MEVKAGGVELGENVDFFETCVYAIGDRYVHDAELSAEGHSRFGAFLSERVQAGSFASAEDDGQYFWHMLPFPAGVGLGLGTHLFTRAPRVCKV